MSANDRDSKNAFFHADSGVNVGHEYIEIAIDQVNATFMEAMQIQEGCCCVRI
jgi:hypothetical protein